MAMAAAAPLMLCQSSSRTRRITPRNSGKSKQPSPQSSNPSRRLRTSASAAAQAALPRPKGTTPASMSRNSPKLRSSVPAPVLLQAAVRKTLRKPSTSAGARPASSTARRSRRSRSKSPWSWRSRATRKKSRKLTRPQMPWPTRRSNTFASAAAWRLCCRGSSPRRTSRSSPVTTPTPSGSRCWKSDRRWATSRSLKPQLWRPRSRMAAPRRRRNAVRRRITSGRPKVRAASAPSFPPAASTSASAAL
mmetsp:Transcript_30708/g.65379  ORF Transcript_30708/g.65379 Transcript_30708/m.65379 type:complete len:248 (-) Transcript_30708:785-1528(-)